MKLNWDMQRISGIQDISDSLIEYLHIAVGRQGNADRIRHIPIIRHHNECVDNNSGESALPDSKIQLGLHRQSRQLPCSFNVNRCFARAFIEIERYRDAIRPASTIFKLNGYPYRTVLRQLDWKWREYLNSRTRLD